MTITSMPTFASGLAAMEAKGLVHPVFAPAAAGAWAGGELCGACPGDARRGDVCEAPPRPRAASPAVTTWATGAQPPPLPPGRATQRRVPHRINTRAMHCDAESEGATCRPPFAPPGGPAAPHSEAGRASSLAA